MWVHTLQIIYASLADPYASQFAFDRRFMVYEEERTAIRQVFVLLIGLNQQCLL